MSSMTHAFDVATEAMASLRLFREHYGSTAAYQDHKAKVVEILRQRSGRGNPGQEKFLKGFADLIDSADRSA